LWRPALARVATPRRSGWGAGVGFYTAVLPDVRIIELQRQHTGMTTAPEQCVAAISAFLLE